MKKILLFCLFFLIAQKPILAANYTVSSGQSIQSVANTVTASDTVTVNAGTYSERVTINSGTFVANGIVIVKGFVLQGNNVKVSGFTVTPTDCGSRDGAIQVTGDNVRVENNTVVNSTRQGIVLTSSADSAVVINNKISHTYNNGIVVHGTNHLLESNEIYDIEDHMEPCGDLNDANGIEFVSSGHTFRKNSIHDMLKANQNGTPHMDAFQTYGDGWNPAARNIVIEQNSVFMGNAATGVLEVAGGGFSVAGFMIEGDPNTVSNYADNIVIKNNIISSHTGLNIGGGGNIHNLKIYNNSWTGNLSSLADPAGINLWHGVTGYEIYNNTVENVTSNHIYLTGATGGTASNNLISTGLIQSTVIDTGKTVASVTNDFNGVSRPQGAAYDIGTVENISNPKTTIISFRNLISALASIFDYNQLVGGYGK